MFAYTVNFVVSLFIAMVVHELGHWVAARLCKVPVTQIGIGWGPKFASLPFRGVECQLRLLPLGAFTRMDMLVLQRLPLSQQLFVLGAGVGINLLLGLLTWGTPFGYMNLALAVGNLMPLYQLDGWKGGMVICRRLLGGKNKEAEWAFTICGALIVALIITAVFI